MQKKNGGKKVNGVIKAAAIGAAAFGLFFAAGSHVAPDANAIEANPVECAAVGVDAPNTHVIVMPDGSGNPDVAHTYEPAKVAIRTGETVKWVNNDTAAHTVTDGTYESKWGNVFDSGVMREGKEFYCTFNEPGTYDYLCAFHPWMLGKVIVKGESKVPPKEPPAPKEPISLVSALYIDIDDATDTVDKAVFASLTNNTPEEQKFWYIVQYKDSEGFTEHISFNMGFLDGNVTDGRWTPVQSFHLRPGKYKAEIYVWGQSMDFEEVDPNPLVRDRSKADLEIQVEY